MQYDVEELISEIQIVYEKVHNSFQHDKRIAIIELTRYIDHAFAFVSYILNKENTEYAEAAEAFEFLSAGYAGCLNLFYDKVDINREGVPLYPSTKEMIDWANSCLAR